MQKAKTSTYTPRGNSTSAVIITCDRLVQQSVTIHSCRRSSIRISAAGDQSGYQSETTRTSPKVGTSKNKVNLGKEKNIVEGS